jgi:Fanconi-associated nuclease 1
MGGKAIATVCQMFAEEFIAGGLPDLVVWRMSDKTVRFCEVKGPGGESPTGESDTRG